MNYLIVAHRAMFGWHASLLAKGSNQSSEFINFAMNSIVFDTLVSGFQLTDDKKLTLENVSNRSIETGYIAFDAVNPEIDRLMRTIGFRKCDICGSWVLPQDCANETRSLYDSNLGLRYCPICLANKQGKDSNVLKLRLEGYHTTGHLVRVINGNGENFTLENVKGCGIEMEYSTSMRFNNGIPCTKDFYEVAKPRGRNRIFRCETDCTVSGEIISNIFTKKSLYDFNWKILTDELELLGNDETHNTVGFHVHFSKTLLGDDPITQAINFLKLQFVLKCYESDFHKVSGRASNDTRYCAFYEMATIIDYKNAIENGRNAGSVWQVFSDSHSYALIRSGDTIELRIGKSTNDPIRLVNYLKLVYGLVENIANVPFEKCYCLNKIFRLVPNEVMNYWRSKGCFMSTNAKDIRGIEFNRTQTR